MRHTRYNPLPFRRTLYEHDVNIDENYSSLIYRADLFDTLPSGTTNVTISNSNYIIPSSSALFTAGYVNCGTLDLDKNFTVEGWFKQNNTIQYLFSIQNFFEILYDKSQNEFRISRYQYDSVLDIIRIPFTLDLTQWNHIAVVRKNDQLTIYVNLVPSTTISYYYDIPSGTAYLGRSISASSSYTGNITLFKVYNTAIYPNLVSKSLNIDSLKYKREALDLSNTGSNYKLLQLYRDIEHISNSSLTISNSNTKYNADLDGWKIHSTGLKLVSRVHITLPRRPFTLEFSFKLDATPTSNLVLCSNWREKPNFYFSYNYSTGKINFTYLLSGIQTIEVGNYIPGEYNHVALVIKNGQFRIYLNGVLKNTISSTLPKLFSLQFNFNKNVAGFSNSSNYIYIRDFAISRLEKYLHNFIPFRLSSYKPSYPLNSVGFNYHNTYSKQLNKPSRIEKIFTVTGASSIAVLGSETYTITQRHLSAFPTTYTISKQFYSLDETISTDITCPSSVIIPAGEKEVTFNVAINSFSTNPFKKRFKLLIYNADYSQEKSISITDTRTLDLTYITALSGYVDGYLSKNSSTIGQLPNLVANRTATTTGDRKDSLYGRSYLINDTSDAVNLPVTLNGVRSVVFLYKETDVVENRTYVGDSNEYTFNGGDTGQLVGNLLLSGDSYTRALNLEYRASKVKISKNDATAVLIDDNVKKVLVFEKTISGIWNSIPIELNLGLSDINLLQGASLDINYDGTVIAIGLKNGNLGEGVVQVWKKNSDTSIWEKDLHLGSPIPAPNLGGFGFSVAISNNGLRLVASEIGSNSVYIFEKSSGLWNSTPVDSFIGTNRFGYSVSGNKVLDCFAITAIDENKTYIYRKISNWGLEATILQGQTVSLHPTEDKVLIGRSLSTNAYLYQKISGVWTLQKTFSSSQTNYAYDVDINNTGDVLISSPGESKVFIYTNSSSWVDSLQFVGTSDYGYSISFSNISFLSSNYLNSVELVTSSGASLPQRISGVRQKFLPANLSDQLDISDANILTFTSNVPLTISKIGAGKSNTSLNGLFFGALFFNRVLTLTEIQNIEVLLLKYLQLRTYSI